MVLILSIHGLLLNQHKCSQSNLQNNFVLGDDC